MQQMAVDLLSKQGGTATLQDLLFRLSSILDQTAVAQFEDVRCKIVAFDAVAATDETSPSPLFKTSFSVLLPFSSKQQNRSSKLCAASSPHSMQQTDGLLVVEARRDTNQATVETSQ